MLRLFDAEHRQLAWQDDPWPLSSNDPWIVTTLPTDGDYYVQVNDFSAEPTATKADPSRIETFDYALQVFDIGGPRVNKEGSEPNDSPAYARPLIYPRENNAYVNALNTGAFGNATDVDVYAMTLPADVDVPSGTRPRAFFWIQAGGVQGNGSTTQVGKAWLLDPADSSGNPLAEIDGTRYGNDAENLPPILSAPVALDTEYYLFLQHPGGKAGANDFYAFVSYASGGGPLETEEAANNVPATAEPLSLKGADFMVEGDIDVGSGDIDYFAIPVSPGQTHVIMICRAQRVGSGLRGLTFSLLGGDGTPIPGASLTEADNEENYLRDVAIPEGQSKILLEIKASAQDPKVTGMFYSCAGQLRGP